MASGIEKIVQFYKVHMLIVRFFLSAFKDICEASVK